LGWAARHVASWRAGPWLGNWLKRGEYVTDRLVRFPGTSWQQIEALPQPLRRAVNARGHFPTEQAAMKCLYLAIMSLDPTGKGRKRWTNRWKAPSTPSTSPSTDASAQAGTNNQDQLDR
jgi:transposase-like protein